MESVPDDLRLTGTAGVAGVARRRHPAGRLRSGLRRHRRAAGVWGWRARLRPACRCAVRPEVRPDLRKRPANA